MTSLFQNKLTRLIIPVFALAFFLSCQKDLSNESGAVIPGQPADLTTKVTSSVSGFVTDENNAAVLGASVTAGGSTTTTDKFGYFEIKNIQVVKNAAVVTVTQTGYFKGIKTYIAADNKAAFFRIKLIPKTNAGSINAVSGGNVTLSNGLIIALPANGVMNAANNIAYSGSVNVAVRWINPVATDLNETMPGDLRGIATDGSLKLLTTYGMAAVELTGASGELLQIATGKKATLTMPIPAAIMGTAPASIPLWSFDEAKGLWKQEGEATKTGSTYVGEVSHFSFWNCDVPANYVHFECTVKDASGNPISGAIVRIGFVANSTSAYGYTDATGYVGGAVPGNASLILDIFTTINCGNSVYTQNFSTTNVNVSLGDITVPVSSNIVTITGTVTDCSNNPVSNGRIIVQENFYYSVYPVSNTGTFNFTRLICNSTASVTITAEDLTAMQQSTPLLLTLTGGTNTLGNLQACGTSTQEFITYTINGGPVIEYSMPADSVYHSGNGSTTFAYIAGHRPASNDFLTIGLNTTGIVMGSTQPLIMFESSQINQQITVSSTSNVNITEYGAVGQFISGTFTGAAVTAAPVITYNFAGSFRVRRNF